MSESKVLKAMAERLNELRVPMDCPDLNVQIGRLLNDGGRMLVVEDNGEQIISFRFDKQSLGYTLHPMDPPPWEDR